MGKSKGPQHKDAGTCEADAQTARLPLIGADGDLTKEFQRCLIELFGRFDVDNDKLLSETELKAFSRAANADEREFTTEEMEEIREHFNWKGDAKTGGLSLRGWIEMYHTQTAGEEEETWRDLEQLGYDGTLVHRSKKLMKTSCKALQTKLDSLLKLGEASDLDAFVKEFVPTDLEEDDFEHFAGRLRENDCTEFKQIVAEIRCCATGQGVFQIDGDIGDASTSVMFSFQAPHAGCERIDREVSFVLSGDDWRAEC
eukprot:TRINITY_DN110755_c0_g1_i1.p1 TRINITY_DN110755_c0_g1~~TRINITY_DN110755_c0_g1_i1.p1  ORF type:complete len:282 (-),score=63.32 TRINITY_DN110755_c0_g1_i1:151-918(-)